MRIAFVWTGVTSYMADCWRHLASEQGVELKVWIDASGAIAKAVGFDTEHVMRGVDYEIVNAGNDLTAETQGSSAHVAEAVVTWRPDFLFVVGWRSAVCRAVVEDRRLKDVPKACCFDMPWRWQLRCVLAPFVLGRFLRQYDAAFVPGVVCARYAKWLRFNKIYKGLFAIDTKRFQRSMKSDGLCSSASPCLKNDSAPSVGRYFLYIGRNSAEKRLEDIRAAHRLYQEQGGKMELKMYGKGLEGGFVAPADVPALMQNAAAFVLASVFDPWPLVLLEAMSAGCPVIASDRCTNRPELGKNWRVFKCEDVAALAEAMRDAERAEPEDHRAENLALARQYDCGEWVKRVKTIMAEVKK